MKLPAHRARLALKGTHDVVGDPTTIEVARLRPDELAIYETLIHGPGIEGQVILNGSKGWRWPRVGPGDFLSHLALYDDIVIGSLALPLAPGTTFRRG